MPYNPLLKRSDYVRFNKSFLDIKYNHFLETREEIIDHFKTFEEYDDYTCYFRNSSLSEIYSIKSPNIHNEIHDRAQELIELSFGDEDRIDISANAPDKRPDPTSAFSNARQAIWTLHQLQRSESLYATIIVHIRALDTVYIIPGMSRVMFAECRPNEIVPTVLCEYNQCTHPKAHMLDWGPIDDFEMSKYTLTRGESKMYTYAFRDDSTFCNLYHEFTDTIVEMPYTMQFCKRPGEVNPNWTAPNWPAIATRSPDCIRVNDIPVFVRGADNLWEMVPYRKAFDYEY